MFEWVFDRFVKIIRKELSMVVTKQDLQTFANNVRDLIGQEITELGDLLIAKITEVQNGLSNGANTDDLRAALAEITEQIEGMSDKVSNVTMPPLPVTDDTEPTV
jgi:seryl-tRNA synthetase